jgi:hypothetical protein
VGAVDEGVAVAPVCGVEEFLEAGGADSRIGGDAGADRTGAAGSDPEAGFGVCWLRSQCGGLDGIHARQRRCLGGKAPQEIRDGLRAALDLKVNAGGVVQHPAGEAEFYGEAVDIGAEADALHLSDGHGRGGGWVRS